MLRRRIFSSRFDVVAGHAGGGRDAVGHAVDAQLRPALAPQIGRRLDAVDRADHVRELFDSLGDAAVQFAGAVDLVGRGALCGGAANPARRVELGAEQRGDDADRLVRADDPGDALLVHAVLQRHDISVGRQVLGDQHRRPFRVIGLDRNHRDVDRFMLCEILDLGQMHRLRLGADIFLLGHAFDREPVACGSSRCARAKGRSTSRRTRYARDDRRYSRRLRRHRSPQYACP